jgi:hypothetical protein
MVLSIPIPQEIVDYIIDCLRKDPDALKTCAMVSHSLLPLSRKHLFCRISLDNSLLSQRLYHIISSNPDLALFIQEIHIVNNNFLPVWFAVDESLPEILNMAHRLRNI